MKTLFREMLCGREFGSAVLHTATLLKWAEEKGLHLLTDPPMSDYDFVQVEALLCAIEARASAYTAEELRAIVATNSRLAGNKLADIPEWLAGADAHNQWRAVFVKATESGELQLFDPVSYLPLENEDQLDQPNEAGARGNAKKPKGLTKAEILAADWPLLKEFNLEGALSDVPKWLVEARVSRGAPGRGSSTWNPAQIAICLTVKRAVNKNAVDHFIRRHFAEFVDEWERSSETL